MVVARAERPPPRCSFLTACAVARLGPAPVPQAPGGCAAAAFERASRSAPRYRAEFLGLRERAPHQRLPGDAGRKAEIVFDAGRGARLAAESPRIQHQHREPSDAA